MTLIHVPAKDDGGNYFDGERLPSSHTSSPQRYNAKRRRLLGPVDDDNGDDNTGDHSPVAKNNSLEQEEAAFERHAVTGKLWCLRTNCPASSRKGLSKGGLWQHLKDHHPSQKRMELSFKGTSVKHLAIQRDGLWICPGCYLLPQTTGDPVRTYSTFGSLEDHVQGRSDKCNGCDAFGLLDGRGQVNNQKGVKSAKVNRFLPVPITFSRRADLIGMDGESPEFKRSFRHLGLDRFLVFQILDFWQLNNSSSAPSVSLSAKCAAVEFLFPNLCSMSQICTQPLRESMQI